MISRTNIKDAAGRVATAVDQSIRLVGHLRGHIDVLAADVHRDSRAVADEGRLFASTVNHKILLTRQGVRASPRALRITAHILAIALRYRLEEGRKRAGGPGSEERIRALHASCAASVRRLCEEERGAILKLGQFLSMRPDLLPSEYIDELGALRDRVPALPFEHIRPQLDNELEGWEQSCFAGIDENAASAASLAQVHRAQTLEGADCAIKVQVPDAKAQVMADVAILRAISTAIPDGSLPFDVPTTLAELGHSLHAELDYLQEAEHCNTLGGLLRSMPGIEVPHVVWESTSCRILTMDWMEGTPLDRALEAADTEKRRRILTRLVDCFARQIFELGYFHADPHAGNILVRDHEDAPDGFALVLLDFGCAQKLGEEVRVGYAALLRSLLRGEREEIRDALQTLGFDQDGNDSEALESMVQAMTAPLQREGALLEWARDPKAATRALIEMSSQVPGLRTPRHFVLLGRVLATLGGMLIDHADAGVSLPALMVTALSRAQSSSQR